MDEVKFKNLLFADCIHGKMVWPKNDEIIGKSLHYYGEFTEGENELMSLFVEEGDTVIDIGANLGTTVLPLAKKVKDSGKVIAFEPQNFISQCLQTTLTLNELFNVKVINSAVSDKSGWAKMEQLDVSSEGNFGMATLGAKGEDVPVMKLDDLELDNCKLVKMDVEGHEWKIIKGGKKFLKKHKPVLYLEAKKNKKKILKWLIENEWRCYWHFAFFFRKDNYYKRNSNIFVKGSGDMNILSVPVSKDQPKDLPEVTSHMEEWDKEYTKFFKKKKIPMPY